MSLVSPDPRGQGQDAAEEAEWKVKENEMASNLIGQSVGVIRYSGKCTREINGGGEGKVIFQSPEHAAAWQQQQASLYRDHQQLNVYRCPYFDHYHLTKRQVVMVNGVLVEEGNKASLDAASATEEKLARTSKGIDTAEVA